MALSGCTGNVSAGDINDIPTPGYASGAAKITWDTGLETMTAGITVSSPVPIIETGLSIPDEIPVDETCTLMCIKITGCRDIQMIRPIRALDPDRKTISYLGKSYDGAGYYLGGEWYGFLIPNGSGSFTVQIADTYFSF